MNKIKWWLYRLGISLKDKGERTGKTWMIRLGYLLSGKVY